MNKIKLNVVKEEKIDNRINNTGRPVNLKSARQIRLSKQKLYTQIHNAFINGKKFKIDNDSTGIYMYVGGDNNTGCIVSGHHGSYVCNVNYIGRTKVQGFTYVLGRLIKITINLKEVTFVKK